MIDKDMLSQVDQEILVALLVDGANTPKNISDIIDRHHQSVMSRLDPLLEDDLIQNKGRGVYELTVAGLESARVLRKETTIEESIESSRDCQS